MHSLLFSHSERICDLMQLENWSIWYAAHSESVPLCALGVVDAMNVTFSFYANRGHHCIAIPVSSNFNTIFSFSLQSLCAVAQPHLPWTRFDLCFAVLCHFLLVLAIPLLFTLRFKIDLLIDQQIIQMINFTESKRALPRDKPLLMVREKKTQKKFKHLLFYCVLKKEKKNFSKKIVLFTLFEIQTVASDVWLYTDWGNASEIPNLLGRSVGCSTIHTLEIGFILKQTHGSKRDSRGEITSEATLWTLTHTNVDELKRTEKKLSSLWCHLCDTVYSFRLSVYVC